MEDNALLEELEKGESGSKLLSESDLRRYQNGGWFFELLEVKMCSVPFCRRGVL